MNLDVGLDKSAFNVLEHNCIFLKCGAGNCSEKKIPCNYLTTPENCSKYLPIEIMEGDTSKWTIR